MALRLTALVVLFELAHVHAVYYRIGVNPWQPMVVCDIGSSETFANDGEFTGYDIDLIRELARRLSWRRSDYQIDCYAESDMFDALNNGTADFLLSGVSVTPEAAALYDFTQPEYLSGLRLLVRSQATSIEARAFSFFDPFDLSLWLVFFATTFVLANIYWLFEFSLHQHSEVSDNYFRGVIDGWFYTLNGFLGEDPFIEIRSYLSRIIQVTYKFTVLILVATYTGSVAAIITAASTPNFAILSPRDISGKTVATSTLASNRRSLQEYGATVVTFSWDTNEDGLEMVDKLKNGDFDALALDRPFVESVAASDCSVSVVGYTFNLQNYAPTFRNGSRTTALFQAVNQQILSMQRSGFFESTADKYMPSDNPCTSPTAVDDTPEPIKLTQLFGLWIIMCVGVGAAILLLGGFTLYFRFRTHAPWKSSVFQASVFLSEAAEEIHEEEREKSKEDTAELENGDDVPMRKPKGNQTAPAPTVVGSRPVSRNDDRDVNQRLAAVESDVKLILDHLQTIRDRMSRL